MSCHRPLHPTSRNIADHNATVVHQKDDDPGHPTLNAARYYFDGSSSPTNLVLWSGTISIALGLAAIRSSKRATNRRQARVHLSPEIELTLLFARA